MQGKITVLNVGDGDAIIVQLSKDDDTIVMVIDGGQEWHYKKVVKPALTKILADLEKTAPDIVVATHYDSDHIGGLIPLVQDYIDGIKEVWVHRSPELDEDDRKILDSTDKMSNVKSLIQFVFESRIVDEYSSIKEEAIRDKSSFVIESIKQLNTLLGLLPADKVRPVYHGDTYPNWPEIKVLGPTEEYYNELFPVGKTMKSIIIDETVDYVNESFLANRKRSLELMSYGKPPCELLKDDDSVRLTPTNKASIIIAIDKGDKRFLFTGDAGIHSFKSIPDWSNELKNLYWLKVPHHGSNNNISKEIIGVMKPEYADNTGDKYEDKPVLDCISTNGRSQRAVRSTKVSGNLSFNI